MVEVPFGVVGLTGKPFAVDVEVGTELTKIGGGSGRDFGIVGGKPEAATTETAAVAVALRLGPEAGTLTSDTTAGEEPVGTTAVVVVVGSAAVLAAGEELAVATTRCVAVVGVIATETTEMGSAASADD